YVGSFVDIVDPVKVEVINRFAVFGSVFIHQRKSRTARVLPDAKLPADVTDEGGFACAHFTVKKPDFFFTGKGNQLSRGTSKFIFRTDFQFLYTHFHSFMLSLTVQFLI